jgi:hypothetical protein
MCALAALLDSIPKHARREAQAVRPEQCGWRHVCDRVLWARCFHVAARLVARWHTAVQCPQPNKRTMHQGGVWVGGLSLQTGTPTALAAAAIRPPSQCCCCCQRGAHRHTPWARLISIAPHIATPPPVDDAWSEGVAHDVTNCPPPKRWQHMHQLQSRLPPCSSSISRGHPRNARRHLVSPQLLLHSSASACWRAHSTASESKRPHPEPAGRKRPTAASSRSSRSSRA